jgi:hypothetical protein
VADKDLMIICRINLDGTLVVVAGTVGVDGFAGDGGPATSANLYNPRGVSVDGAGGFYIAESENNRIRYVDASGIIRTVAGNAFVGFSGDNGAATSAQLSSPKGVQADGVGGFYIADSFNNRVRHVDGYGIIRTIAGGYQAGYSGDGGPADAALLTSPRHVAPDGAGGIFISDQDNACVRRVFTNGTIATVAGLGAKPSSGDGGLGINGFVVAPKGGAVDSKGTFYFVDSGNIRCIYANGTLGTVIRQNLPATSSTGLVWNMQPTELGLDSNDNLYITDAGHIVWLRYANGSIVHVAGTGLSGWSGDGGPATSARIYAPTAVKSDEMGGFYLADYFPTRIRHAFANGTIFTIAGNGGFGMQGDGGAATSAQLVPVSSIMTDGSGGILLSGSNTIRHVYANGLINTMSSDRYFPYALISDRAGAYYLSEYTQVNRVFPNGSVVLVAGLPSNGYYGDGGPPGLAGMNQLTGLGLTSDGILYICDQSNNRIRAILPSSQCSMTVDNFTCSASSSIGDCTLCGTNVRAPLYVYRNGAACYGVSPASGGSTSCMSMWCALVPSAGGVQVVRVQSQFGDSTYSFAAPSTPPLLNITAPNNVLPIGATFSLSSQGSALSHVVALHFVGNAASGAGGRIPCFGLATAYNAGTNTSALTCAVQLVSEAGFSAAQQVQLILDNAAIVLLPVSTINVSFVRPEVNVVSNPVIANEGGGAVNVTFAFGMPSSALVGAVFPTMPYPCGGNGSSLRCWVGTSLCSSCTFRNDTSVLCIPPAGSAVLARVTVELCRLFNATSDGLDGFAAVNTTSPHKYVSYNPSSHLQSSAFLEAQRISTYNGTANIELGVSPGLGLLLASLISEMDIGGAPCSALLPSPTDPARLVCYGWSVVSDLALSVGSKGRFNASIAVLFRGTSLSLSTTVPLVYVPSVINVLPSRAAPGALLSITGRWLDVDAAPVVTLGGSLSCVNVSAVTSSSLVCTLPTVIPASTLGYPNLRIEVTTSVGSTYQPLIVTVPVETTVELISTPTVAALSSFTALSGGVVIPLRPPIVVQATGEVTVSCSINIATYTCPNNSFVYGLPFLTNPSPPSIVGASTLSAPTPTAAILRFSDVGIHALSGCALNLTISCTDTLAHTATTESSMAVTMSQFHLAWNLTFSPAAAFSVTPSDNLMDLRVTFSSLNSTETADLPAITDVLSCIAMIFPEDASMPTSTPLSQASGSLSKVGAQLTFLDFNVAQGKFTGLSTSLCALGAQYAVHAECTWLPTGEQMRLQPLTFSIPNVSLCWVGRTEETSIITALASTNIPLSVQIVASSSLALPTQIPCRWQVSRLSTYSVTLVGADFSIAVAFLNAPFNVSVMLQGSAGASLDAMLQCTMWDRIVTSPPLTLRTSSLSVQAVSIMPSTFIPSDSSQPWPITPALSVKIVDDNTNPVHDTSCTLSVVTEGVGLVGIAAGGLSGLATGIPADSTGVITLPLFGINSPIDNTGAPVTLRLACQRTTGDAAPPVLLNFTAPLLHTVACSQLPSTTTSGSALPAFSTVLVQDLEDGDAVCQGTAALQSLTLPKMSCTISQRVDVRPEYLSSANATLFLQGAVQPLDATSRMATFTAFTVSASPGIKFPLKLSCSIGSIVIPPTQEFDVQVVGCDPGTQTSGIFCQKCAGGEFSMGSSHSVASVLGTCQRCPAAGATCKDGLIALHSDYYRAPSQQDQPLGPSTQLYACKSAGACVVNASTLSYSCAVGYTGPLCGVCDASLDYVQFGSACAPCWAPGASAVLIAFLVLLVFAALARVALRRSDGKKSRAAIALKIALSYLQAVGSLRAFAAGGTAAYHDVFGWTDTVSASPFSFGALQCLWRPSFLSQYVATVMLPGAAAVAVMLIFLAAVSLRSLRLRPAIGFDREAWLAAVRTWWKDRRHISTLLFVLFLAYMSIISSSLRALDCTEEIDGIAYLRQDLRVQCYVGEHAAASALAYVVLVVLGIGFPLGLFWLLASASPSRLADPQFQSANGFLYGGYRTGNEMDQRIAEAAAALYEARNTSAVNNAGEDAEIVGIPNPLRNMGAGAALPIGGEVKSGRKSTTITKPRHSILAAAADILRSGPTTMQQRHSVTCFSRCPRHVMWWESVVLLRKAVLVLLALRVSNPYYQSGGATLWLSACLLLHVHLQPYSDPLFNILETWSLASAVATAVISAMLLQYDMSGRSFGAQSTGAMTSDEWGITIGMLLVNLTALCVLVGTWLQLQWRIAAKATPVQKLLSTASTFRLNKPQRAISQSASVFVHEDKSILSSPPPCAPIVSFPSSPLTATTSRLSMMHTGNKPPIQAESEDGSAVAFAPVSVGEKIKRHLKR